MNDMYHTHTHTHTYLYLLIDKQFLNAFPIVLFQASMMDTHAKGKDKLEVSVSYTIEQGIQLYQRTGVLVIRTGVLVICAVNITHFLRFLLVNVAIALDYLQ